MLLTISIIVALNGCTKDATSENSSIATSEISAETLSKSLVAWYTFDGDVLDHSGNGNDVIFNNAVPAAGKSGIENTAYKFDGSTTFMKVANSE